MSTITTDADFKEFVASIKDDPLYEEPLAFEPRRGSMVSRRTSPPGTP
jgi:hypothetical protein